jgi:aspartyl-tRNA(Asn)/glutamyl-tRNA(Gln) amidotransferase subunit A
MEASEAGYLSIATASDLIASKELSPVELTRAIFQRIHTTDQAVHSYVRLMEASATEEARGAERRALTGERRGPLDGIPIAVKDLFDTAGVVTTAGSAVYRDRVPAHDAHCVALLRQAGAVIVGKTNTHEFAMGGTTNNPHFGATHNPWALDRVPGGSSGGSASALAAGQCLGALGTDTMGSIRLPAALCGVTGHKPSYGLVGRTGIMPLTLTLDHAGPMARDARDCALLLNTLAGYDPHDLDSIRRPAENFLADWRPDLRGVRLAVVPSVLEGSDDAVLENFGRSLSVLRDLGAVIGSVEPLAGLDAWRSLLNLRPEGAAVHRRILGLSPELISETIRTRLQVGLETLAVDYVEALQLRKAVERRFVDGLTEWDAYVLPTCHHTAEPIVGPDPGDKLHLTALFNYARLPSISVPNGFDTNGLPTALMLSGRPFTDAEVLAMAAAYQGATDFHLRRPAL